MPGLWFTCEHDSQLTAIQIIQFHRHVGIIRNSSLFLHRMILRQAEASRRLEETVAAFAADAQGRVAACSAHPDYLADKGFTRRSYRAEIHAGWKRRAGYMIYMTAWRQRSY